MSRSHSLLIIFLVTALTGGCIWLTSQLRFDYNFEAFFPHNDPQTDFYYTFRETFETDNDFFIVALQNNEGLFDKAFLGRVDSLTQDLRSVNDMVEVAGPTTLQEFRQDPLLGQVFRTPLLRFQEPEYFATDSVRIWQNPGLVGSFFSPDGRSVAINMKHAKGLSKKRCDDLSYAIEACTARYKFDETHVIGRALGQRVYVEMMIKELLLFITISLILTIFFLFIAFRSGWGIAIPTLIVLLSILWTLGFMRLIGKNIDLMLTVLPTILFVVGMSDSVHVLTKYMQELRNGKKKEEAIRYAFKSIRLATFLTALTTSIGFLSLVFSNIRPISEFGIYTSVGVMLAYGLTYTMLPAILILAKPTRMHAFAMSEDFWTRRLHTAFAWLLRWRKQVMYSALGITLLSVGGIFTIKVNNTMLEDLRDDHRLKKEFRYMEEHFAGCRPFEMAIFLPKGANAFDHETLRQLDTLHQFLVKEYDVGSLLSLPTLVKTAEKALHTGQQDYYALPDSTAEIEKVQKLLMRKEMKELLHLTYAPDTNWLRLAGKVHDAGRQHYDSLNTALVPFVKEHCPLLSDFRITGTAHLIDLNNRYLVQNMLWDLLLSIGVIGLIMGIVYRSWKMIPLTIIPNLIPLIIVGGIMGFAGIPLKVSTSIIFNIAFGIAVDDTIHFLARVRTYLGRGYSPRYAVKRTFLTTGKAMIVTTLILSAGFMTLVFSDFLGTYYIGLLISLTLFIGIIAELTVTPLVVMFFYKPKRSE